MRDALDRLVRTQPAEANRILSIGTPILLDSGEVLRGPHVLVPGNAENEEVTPEKLESWVKDGWADLRLSSCALWIERCRRIHAEVEALPAHDTSSRHLRNRRYWREDETIQPGKLAGWILSSEDGGWRIKR